MIRIVGISGSLRSASFNTSILRAAAQLLPPGVGLQLLDGLADLPHYDEDLDTAFPPASVTRLRRTIDSADAILIATPEFNGSMPGALKNAIDWASRPYGQGALQNRPTAVVGATTGLFGAVWAQADVRRVLGIAGARVLDREVPIASVHERFDADGRLTAADTRAQLRLILGELVDAVAEARTTAAAAA